MLLQYQDGEPFASGACSFRGALAGRESEVPKVIVDIEINGIQTEAAVDTGGIYLIVHPDLVDVDPAEGLLHTHVWLRGHRIDGSLHRVELIIPAEDGASLHVEATALVPLLSLGDPTWLFPNYLGWSMCLERMRFALDPQENMFYFGA